MPTDVEQNEVSKVIHPDTPHFWIVKGNKQTFGFLIVVLVVLCALCGMWMYCHQDDNHAKQQVASSVEISPRVLVPELKMLPEDQPEMVREEMVMPEQDELKEARIKSSIVAHDDASGMGDVVGKGKDTEHGQGPQDQNSRFARAVADQGIAVSKARAVGDLPYKILQGKMIEAVLEPRATSDLPGMVCATVQRNVFGMQKRLALIPWGSRVCGQYSAEMRTGQERLFVVWNMLRRPDGVEVALDSPGADQLGTAGMGGAVDTHFARIFGISSLLSIINAGSSSMRRGGRNDDTQQDYYRDAVASAAAQTAQQAMQPYLSIPPTVVVPPGAKIRIYVNRDLDFTDLYQQSGHEAQVSDMMIYE